MTATFDMTSPDLWPGNNAGADLIGQQVQFQLRYSDQASVFNADRHDDTLTGTCRVAYDGMLVVTVAGWRFGHTVPAQHVAAAP